MRTLGEYLQINTATKNLRALIAPAAETAFTRSFSRLARFSGYPQGWAHGDGDAFSATVVATAGQLLWYGYSVGLGQMDLFPRRDGALVVSFYIGSDVHDFTIFPDQQILWEHEQNDEVTEDMSFTIHTAAQKLVSIAQTLWNSSESSQKTITIQQRSALRVQGSLDQVPITGFPAFIVNALKQRQEILAHI